MTMDLSELQHLRYGTQIPVGLGVSTVLADFDFETYSEAGYVWDEPAQKWLPLPGVTPQKRGLTSVGVVVYTEDRHFEPLMMWYDLKDGHGARYWQPGMPNPQPLFDHLARGLLLSAWNVAFEERVWKQCQRLYGWPTLPYMQLRCDMAKSRAWGRPGSLDKACEVAKTTSKDKAGTDLIKVFCMPQAPTKKNGGKKRIYPGHEPEKFASFQSYGYLDIVSEAHVSSVTPDLSPIELEYWQVDQAINRRGVHVDLVTVDACIKMLAQAEDRYGVEMMQLTGGIKATELKQLQGWCTALGYSMTSMDEDAVDAALKDLNEAKCAAIPGLATVRRVLELRSYVGSSSVKKVYAMRNQASALERLHDLFLFHATRTGRPTGSGPQPTNLPKAGPDVWLCACGKYYGRLVEGCPWCGKSAAYRVNSKGFFLTPGAKPNEWNPEAAGHAIEILRSGDLATVERYFGEGMLTIAGCLRGMLTAGPGMELISSDFTAIEAVILACMAGEQWRIDLFRTGGKIYEKSGSLVTGIPYDDMLAYKVASGQHHPARQTGKTAELGLGYQGWIGAWRAFDESNSLSDEEIKKIILAWRDASPAIVEFWGGQSRRQGYGQEPKWERFGVEGAFIDALLAPGTVFEFRGLRFQVVDEVLYLTLPSGRHIAYHNPKLHKSDKWGCVYGISYWGWNSNPKNGAMGWIQIDTWGGRLVENIVQAIGNDILRFASVNLERAGYPIVLHVYDEIVSEVPIGFGTIENFEAWMGYLPAWARMADGTTWPISAAGGWRGLRYRKG